MPHMPYARRAHLVGSSLRRPTAVTIRGDRRRNDSDNVSNVPYFDGLPGSPTLIVAHTALDGGTATVSLTQIAGVITLEDALDQLTTGLASIHVRAIDLGGCVGLVSDSSHQNDCALEVTGGTAASALGFDLSKQPYSARSGDLASAPEGKIENAFGAALPVSGENFTTDTMTRAFGRVMANTDVLASEADKEEAHLQRIGVYSGASVPWHGSEAKIPLSAITNTSVPLADMRIFVGAYPEVASNVELKKYFVLVNNVTEQLAPVEVTGIYDTNDLSLLGNDVAIISGATITDIPAGDVIAIPSTTNVVAGYYAEITSATNGKWLNNGYRWAVEEVMDSTHLRLRPMSGKEMTLVGEPVSSALQPITELSTELGVGESYGTVTIRAGNFRRASDVVLAISPPITSESSVIDIYASVPVSKRNRAPNQFMESLTGLQKRIDSIGTAGVVTVGSTGRFSTIQAAVTWIESQVAQSYVGWEILVIEPVEVSAKVSITGTPNPLFITIRGAKDDIELRFPNGSTSYTYFGLTNAFLRLSNISIRVPNRLDYKIASADNGTSDASVELSNVRFTTGTPASNVRIPLVPFEFQDVAAGTLYSVQREYVGGKVQVYYVYESLAGPYWSKTTTPTTDSYASDSGAFSAELGTNSKIRLSSAASPGVDGVLTRTDIRTLVGGSGSDASALHTHLPDANPSDIAAAANIGASYKLARQDHVHAHGSQAGGSSHAAADNTTAGFLSSTTQTIGGVKTFLESPLVPETPSGSAAAVSKSYAESYATSYTDSKSENYSYLASTFTTNYNGFIDTGLSITLGHGGSPYLVELIGMIRWPGGGAPTTYLGIKHTLYLSRPHLYPLNVVATDSSVKHHVGTMSDAANPDYSGYCIVTPNPYNATAGNYYSFNSTFIVVPNNSGIQLTLGISVPGSADVEIAHGTCFRWKKLNYSSS